MARPRNFVLGLLVVACALSLWLARGRPASRGEEPAAVAGPHTSAAPVEDPVPDPIHLRILNATEQGGLAGDVALLAAALGCVVEGVGNAEPWPGSPSLLVNRRLSPDRALSLAGRLGGLPVIREWDGRTTEDAVLVLGEDFERVRQAARASGP